MNLKAYRNFVNTTNRRRVMLRPMTIEDRDAVTRMFQEAGDEDVRFLYDEVRNSDVVAGWFERLDYERIFPLLALHNSELVGDATLHRQTGGARHIGELRIFLTRNFRGVGLGSLMLRELIAVARDLELMFLTARVVSAQLSVIKAFRQLGFKRMAEYDDFFIAHDKTLHDVSMMVYSLAGEREFRF
ncbi:MAG: GNAT family N-acetyltransferase [Deltaproteobacteria bacterium]|nr:GNAT family N-acetyltransferase [Candidatus Anaeroferrophillacea bacterium]